MAKKEFNCKHCGGTFKIDVDVIRLACETCIKAGHAQFGQCRPCLDRFEEDERLDNEFPRVKLRNKPDLKPAA